MSLVIPKRRVAASIRLSDGPPVAGRFFLDYIDPIHRGEQTLLDRLNGESLWLPLETDGGVEMVNRQRIVVVEPGGGVPPELVRRENSPVFRRERVTLRTGQATVEGRIAMDLPDEFSRVSDFLNFPEDFFAVETDGGPVLVSKIHLTALVPHEDPPSSTSAAAEIEERA